MFNKRKFKAVLLENGLTIDDVADILKISKVTVYRKMNGQSDFFLSEILKISEMIGRKNVVDIFFAEQVS